MDRNVVIRSFRIPIQFEFPSASYTRRERLPHGPLTDGHATVRPDLVAEVLFPRSSQAFVREKLTHFLAVGVPWAWMVDPKTQDRRHHPPGWNGETLRAR